MQFILISCLLAMLAMQASAVLTPAQRAIITEHVNRFETIPTNRRFAAHVPIRNNPRSPPHPIFHPGFGKRDVEAKRFDDIVKLTKNDVEAKRFDDIVKLTKNDVEAVKRFDEITKKDIMPIPAVKDTPIVEKEIIKRESKIATLPIEKRLAETKRFNEELVKKDVVIRSVVDSSSPIVVKRLDTPLPVEKKFIKERSGVDIKRTLPFNEEVATMNKDAEIRSIVVKRLDTPLPIEKKIIV